MELDKKIDSRMVEQYYCVDLFRFMCSLLVVAIHVEPLWTYSRLVNFGVVNYVARIAVPFFFVVSGYFLFKKTSCENFKETVSKKYAYKILKLYIIWTIIYLPLSIRNIIQNNEEFIYGVLDWLRRFIFMGGYSHLWYLNAVIVSTLILTWLIKKKISINKVLLIAFLCIL